MRRGFTLIECLISLALSGLALGLLGAFLLQMVEFSKVDLSDQSLLSGRQVLAEIQREVLMANGLDSSQPSSRLVFTLIEPGPHRFALAYPWNDRTGQVQVSYFIDGGLRRQQDAMPPALLLAEAVGLGVSVQGSLLQINLALETRTGLVTLEAQAHAWNVER